MLEPLLASPHEAGDPLTEGLGVIRLGLVQADVLSPFDGVKEAPLELVILLVPVSVTLGDHSFRQRGKLFDKVLEMIIVCNDISRASRQIKRIQHHHHHHRPVMKLPIFLQ